VERAGMGLRNEVGERNCFINVVIQSMWHLRAFRDGFLTLIERGDPANGTTHTIENSGAEDNSVPAAQVLAALKGVFAEYQRAERQQLEDACDGEKVEPGLVEPASLREAMSMTGSKEFQLSDFADAAEAHMMLLDLLGATAAGPLVERVFGMSLEETKCCTEKDKTPSEPLVYVTNVHYVSARAISEGAGQFDTILYQCLHQSSPNGHDKRVRLRNKPHVFTLGLVWTSANESQENIKRVINTVSQTVMLNNVFDADKTVEPQVAEIRGMFCYYGKHFCAVFKSDERGCWLVFDDSMVKEVGTWADVQEKCYRGALQPCLLFYECKA